MSYLQLSSRNLMRNRRRTALLLLALIVGVGANVAFRGFMFGMRNMIIENQKFGALGALQVHRKGYVANVMASPLKLSMPDSLELRQSIEQVAGVDAVSARLEFTAQLTTPDKMPPPLDGSEIPEAMKGRATFLTVTAFLPEHESKVTPKRLEWLKAGRGQFVASNLEQGLMLNDDLAKSAEVPLFDVKGSLPAVEQQLALLAPDADGLLNGENMVLVGTLASATPNDRRVGYMTLPTAQRLLRMEGKVTEYAIAISNRADIMAVQRQLQSKLGQDFEVHRWDERLPFINDLVALQDFVFQLVSYVFLLVVLLGIINAMLMGVLERVREIGTMMAVGLRRKNIVTMFVLEGALLGLAGGVLGVLIGYAWVAWSGHVGIPIPAPGAKIPTLVRPTLTVSVIIISLLQAVVGASLAALWPAYRASKLQPVEALSHV